MNGCKSFSNSLIVGYKIWWKRKVAKRQTASTYLKQLAEIGVLVEIRAGKEKLFAHPKLIRLLAQSGNEFVFYQAK